MKTKKSTTRTPLTTTKDKKTASTRTPAATTKMTRTAAAKTPTTTAPVKATSGTTKILKSRATQEPKTVTYSAEDVATRAYFISLERGGSPDENWTIAEEEFRAGLWA